MKDKIKHDKKHAYMFSDNKRFIYDLICVNDMGEFEKEFPNIYPKSLQLKCEHSGMKATFLELDIEIQNNMFSYKLFDKRDNYHFEIVRMPYISSNIPARIFYSTFTSELLRIAKATLKINDFTDKSRLLIKRMRSQGGEEIIIKKFINKMIHRHQICFNKYNCMNKDLIREILSTA